MSKINVASIMLIAVGLGLVFTGIANSYSLIYGYFFGLKPPVVVDDLLLFQMLCLFKSP